MLSRKRLFLLLLPLIPVVVITTVVYRTTQKADMFYQQGHRYYQAGQFDKALDMYEESLRINPSRKVTLVEMVVAAHLTGRDKKVIGMLQDFLQKHPKNRNVKKALADLYSWNHEYSKAIEMYTELAQNKKDKESARALAEIYLWDGQYGKARQVVETLLKANPKDAKAKLILAKSYHYAGNGEEAAKIYQELVNAKAIDKAQVEKLLGEARIMSKDFTNAITAYQKVLKKEPKNVSALVSLGDVLGWMGRYDEAITQYQKVLELQPGYLDVKVKMAKVYAWAKDYAKAEALYKEILDVDPRNKEAFLSLGEVLTWDKKYGEARRLIDASPAVHGDIKAMLLYGKSLLFSRDFAASQKIFKEIVDRNPGNLEAMTYLADAYVYDKQYDKGIRLYQDILAKEKTKEVRRKLAEAFVWSRQYNNARAVLNDLLTADPKDFASKLLLAKSYHYEGQIKKAEKIYRELLADEAMNPNEIKALLGEAYAIAKDYPRAIAQYEEILRDNPQDEKVRVALGDALSWMEKYDASIAEYQRVLNENPDNTEVKAKMATVCGWKKDYAKAEKLYKEVLAKDPKNREALLSLGEILVWAKKYSEAAGYLDAAGAIKEDKRLKMLYAKMYVYSGNIPKAQQLLEAIQKEDPENTGAKTLLAEAYAIGKKYQKAITLDQEVLAKEKTAEVQRKLAEVYVWDRQYAKAREILNALLRENPKDMKSKILLAQSYHYAGDAVAAAKIYHEILDQGAPDPLAIKAALADTYMIGKDYPKAIAQFEEVLREDPKNLRAHEELADIFGWTGRYYEAIQQCRKVLELDPDNLEWKQKMATVYSWSKDFGKAESLYREILAKDPQHIPTLLALGEILTWSKRYAEALDVLGKALKEDDNDRARILYAGTLLYSGAKAAAQKMLQEVLQRTPDNVEAKVHLADAYTYDKQYARGIALYQEVLAKEKTPEIQRKLAEAYMWDKQYAKCREILEALLKQAPDDFRAKLLLGRSFQYAGQANEAERIYKELLKEGTVNSAEIKAALAESYMIAKDYPKAVAQCEEILKEDPGNIAIRTLLADMLSWLGRYDESLDQYEILLKSDSGNFAVKTKMATIYSWQKNFAKAEAMYLEILKKDPHDRDALLAMGDLLTTTRRYEEAKRYLDEAMARKGDARAKLLYGRMLLYSGDMAGSYKLLKEAIAEEPDNMAAKTCLADAYAYNKEFDKAIALYEEILSQGQDSEVQRKLADVLSWAKRYDRAITMYDKTLREKWDPRIALQRARVLGWAKRYGEALKAYQELYEKTRDSEVGLEKRAKECYWNGWVESAIHFYRELLAKDPDNVEARFDLSQIYSYQSMWKKAIEEYNKILETAPTHFRAKEGLQKLEILSKHFSVRSGYTFTEALSTGRDSDVHKQSFFAQFRQPVNEYLSVEAQHTGVIRAFTDFDNILENESRLAMIYQRNPTAWMDMYYDLVAYNRGIDPISQFGGHAGARLFDKGTTTLSYVRERLENSSTVIRDNFYSDNVRERLTYDHDTWLKAGADYGLSLISDKNTQNQAGADVTWLLSIDPKRLAVKYRGAYSNYSHASPHYFSPSGFWMNSVLFNWRHFLNKEEIFFGANDLYYDTRYEITFDAKGVTTHKVSAEIYWDITKQLSFDISAAYTTTSADIYNGRDFSAWFRYYF